VDGIITQESQTEFQIKKHPKEFASIVKTEPPIKTIPYYFVISHQFANKYPKLTQQIWDTVAELRQTKLPALYTKYYSL
jgi:polar amino acid transport system substrate-binding protein